MNDDVRSDPDTIAFRRDARVEAREVARLFVASGIRRPAEDVARIARMLDAADLTITAWHGDRLIGIARSLTDFAYCCYLSDLAVDREFQSRGVGRELVARTRAAIGDAVTLVLVSSPEAVDFYPRVGFARSDTAFVLRRSR